jgi:hypothetical protein
MSISVEGLREIQAANLQLLRAVNPRGGLGRAVKEAADFLFRYSVGITHRVTGTLAASHRIDFAAGRLLTSFTGATIGSDAVARIYIDPGAKNPVTRQRPVIYGPAEHGKGGTHAFYRRAVSEQGTTALAIAHTIMMSELPKGSISIIRFGSKILGRTVS